MRDEPSALLRYSLPVVANALALLITVMLGPILQGMRAFLLFAAVAVCAWYGGVGPSILSIILAAFFLDLFLLDSGDPMTLSARIIRLAVFVFAALLVTYLQIARRRAEERFAREDRFRKAMEESMLAGVAMIDLEGRQTYVNRAFCEMVGWSEEDLVGSTPPYLYWAPEELDKINDAFNSVRKGDLSPTGFELLLKRKSGERFHAVVLAAPLKGSQGEITGWLASVYDISERKRIEQDRELLLLREQKAREEAELAYRARDEFIAVVSHELRNPLNSMLGWLHILRTRRLDEAVMARALETIEGNAKMQARLINDMLDISRISAGKLQLNLSTLDLAKVIETAVEQARPAADEKDISMDMKLEAIMVLGDPDRLGQAVQNLLSNAVKFTPRKGAVTVELRRLEASAQIIVRDNGAGINRDLLPHVFDKFRQGGDEKRQGGLGLGLGLTIVRDLIDMHGGSVRADSEGLGRGATFAITLPLNREPG